jgi:hypothetical protein
LALRTLAADPLNGYAIAAASKRGWKFGMVRSITL